MRKVYILIIFSSLFSNCAEKVLNQGDTQSSDLRREIASIQKMPYIPELSGDKTFWEVVKRGLEVIPSLIQLLDDTVATAAVVPNYGGNYAVGDIAYSLVIEIIRNVPTDKLISSDASFSDEKNYWIYIRSGFENRLRFQQRLKEWFAENKNDLHWVSDPMKYKTASDWSYSSQYHPAGGYFLVNTK